MTSQSTSAEAPTEFMLFPNLPKELRLLVWKNTLPGPRIVELKYHEDIPAVAGDPPEGYFTSLALLPTALSVCQESRSEAQTEYELTFPAVGSIPMVYFNTSLDTLLISLRGWMAIQGPPQIREASFDKIERICFSAWTIEQAISHLESPYIDGFIGVKTIMLAVDLDSTMMGRWRLSIEEIELTEDEEILCADQIAEFQEGFLERHPDRELPTVLLKLIKRNRST